MAIIAAIVGAPPLAGYANNSDLIPVGDKLEISQILPVRFTDDTKSAVEPFKDKEGEVITIDVLVPGAIDSSNWLVNPSSQVVKVDGGVEKYGQVTFNETDGTAALSWSDDPDDGENDTVPLFFQSTIPAMRPEFTQSQVGGIPFKNLQTGTVSYSGVTDIMPAGENPDMVVAGEVLPEGGRN